MARSVDALLARLMASVPDSLAPLRPVLAGLAAMLARAEEARDELLGRAMIGTSEGSWLTLLARGLGIYRGDGESDESVRERLRNPESVVTRGAIEEAATALLAPPDEAVVIEHHAAPHMACDVDAACDVTDLFDQHNAFTVIVPEGYPTSTYAAILVEVARIKALGVRFWLIVEG